MNASWDDILKKTTMIYRIDDDIINFYCPKRFPAHCLDSKVFAALNCDISPEHVNNAMKDLKSFSFRTLDKLDVEMYMCPGETFIALYILSKLRDILRNYFKQPRVNE